MKNPNNNVSKTTANSEYIKIRPKYPRCRDIFEIGLGDHETWTVDEFKEEYKKALESLAKEEGGNIHD